MYHNKHSILGPSILAFIAGMAVWAIFGKKIQESKVAEEAKDSYDQMVDEVTGKYAKAKGISKNELTDLVDELKVHWNKIKRAWDEGGE